jgi:hypothetical protein
MSVRSSKLLGRYRLLRTAVQDQPGQNKNVWGMVR